MYMYPYLCRHAANETRHPWYIFPQLSLVFSITVLSKDWYKAALGQVTQMKRQVFFSSRFPRIMFLFFHFQTTPTFWKEWHDFEVRHGNEDTFREMLRIKRSVQAQFNTQVSKMKFSSFGLMVWVEFCPYKNIPQSKTVLIFCHFVESVRYAGCNLENLLVMRFMVCLTI